MLKKVTWIIVVAAAAFYLLAPLSDPDLWWHVIVGRWIVTHRALPAADHWNMFAAGAPWRAYSWSNEILYAFADTLSGCTGLLFLKLVLAFALAFSLAYIAGRISRNWTLALLLSLAGAAAVYAHFDLRPQTVSWILFAWLLYAAEKLREKGVSLARLAAPALLAALWANSHITVIIGLAAGFLWLCDAGKSMKMFRLPFAFAGATLLGSLATPDLGREWLTTLEKANHPFMHMYIVEFQPATLHHAGAVLVLLLFAVYCLLAAKLDFRSTLFLNLLVGGLTLAAFAVQKFIPYAAVAAVCASARVYAASKGTESNFRGALELLTARLASLSRPVLLIICLAALLFCYMRAARVLRMPVDAALVPVSAVDFVAEHNLPLRFANTFNDGGYLLYRFSSENGETKALVPIDGRTNVNDREVVKLFLQAFYAKPSWRAYFEKIQPETVLWPNASPLVTVLLESGDWCHAYPEPDKNLLSDPWSVFVSRSTFEERSGELKSRNCGAQDNPH